MNANIEIARSGAAGWFVLLECFRGLLAGVVSFARVTCSAQGLDASVKKHPQQLLWADIGLPGLAVPQGCSMGCTTGCPAAVAPLLVFVFV